MTRVPAWLRHPHHWCLRAYPAAFRATFGADLERAFEQRLMATPSRGRAIALAAFLCLDAIASGLAERVAARGRRSRVDASGAPPPLGESLRADVRLAFRQLRHAPVFAALTVMSLALGIGANSAIFSVLHAVLLRPLPYERPDELVAVWSDNTRQGEAHNPVSPANFEAFRGSRAFSRVEAMYSFLTTAQIRVDNGDPERVVAATMTPGMFDLLGRRPHLGREFRDADPEPGIVLSYRFFVRRFAADPAIVGRTVGIPGISVPVVVRGVMPDGFTFPYRSMLAPTGFTSASAPDIWIPLTPQGDARLHDATGQPNRTLHYLAVVGRLAPDVGVDQARADLREIARRRSAEFPDSNEGWSVTLRPLHEQTVGEVRSALVMLGGGVGLLLLITCVNVANVLLARATGRQRDLAIQTALGASRGRLLRQALVESATLGALGGVAGLGLMVLATRVMLALAPADLPRVHEASLNLTVLAFVAVVSLGSGLLVGLVPALSASQSRAQDSLRDGPRTTASRARQRVRAALVVVQVALATTLTVGAGLLLRSFVEVLAVDPGFRSGQLLTFQMFVPPRLIDNPSRLTFYDAVEARTRQLPGVVAVGGTTRLPLGSTEVTSQVDVQGRDIPPADRPEVAFRRAVFDYFGTMGIPVVRGRTFTSEDGTGAPLVVVVNTAFADRIFPGEDPVGRQVRFGAGATHWYTIVGVIGSIRHGSLEDAPRPEVYINYRQGSPVSPFIAVRASTDLAGVERGVREILRDLGADPPADVRTMDEVRLASVAERRFVLVLAAAFGTLSLLLAGLGVYGVITLVAAERTREVGIRLALGATPAGVMTLLLGHAVRLATAGVVIGIAVGAAMASAMRSQLFGIGVADPLTYVVVASTLVVVAAGAALVPGRRAMRVDAAVTLRA